MLTRFLKMLIFEQIKGQMSKSALLRTPYCHISSGGVNNGVSLEGKMDQSYHRTHARV